MSVFYFVVGWLLLTIPSNVITAIIIGEVTIGSITLFAITGPIGLFVSLLYLFDHVLDRVGSFTIWRRKK